MKRTIAILGKGAWGSALAATLSKTGANVLTWDHRSDDTILSDANLVLAAVPAQATRDVLTRVKAHLRPEAALVMTAKGLEIGTQLRQTQIAAELVPSNPALVLSGPGFAADLTHGLPTAVTLATHKDFEDAEAVQSCLATPGLRPYLSTDIVGVELGGALKNVIAIACGTTMGAGLGESARAAVMTRGLGEVTRVAMAAGARMSTLQGLSGLGDLALTCASEQSRNYRYGLALGQAGRAPKTGTYEGAKTAGAAAAMFDDLGIEAPIIAATAALVAGRITVPEAVNALMARPLRHE